MGMKLLRGGRSSRKDTNNNKQDTLPTTRIEHESLSTHGDSSHPVVTPPHALDHVREDDDVSSIHFGESVSSPTYCYTQAPPQSRRTPRFLATPPPLKFVRSDSHVMNHERPTAVSPTSRGSATPPIDNTTRSSPALTSLLYLSLVTFELKNTTSGKHVVRETLQRHVYTSVEDELFHTTTARRKSVPVDVDNCDFVQEDEGVYEEMAMRHLQRRDVPAAMNVYQTLVSSSGNKFQQSQLYSQLSVLYVLHGNRQKAVWSSERSLAIYRKEGLAQEQVTSLLEMGVMLLYSQKPNDALRKFRQAFQLECKLVGYHHSSIPLLLNNMAVAHVVLGDSDESFILLKESLELQRNAQQTNLESLKQMGITLLNLGIVSSKRKAHIEATSYFEEGLMVMESILGVDNAFVQLCSTTLEELIVQRNSFTGLPPKRVKMPVFGNADGIPIGALHHPVDVIVMGSLQHELTLEQRVRNAVTSTFRSSMLGVVERKPPKSVPIDVDGDRVLDAELHLSGIHSLVLQHTRRNEIDEALELLRSTLRSHKTKYGQVHHLVGTALHNIALVNLFAGRYKDAEWYFQEAVSVRIAALGTDHPDISVSVNMIYEYVAVLFCSSVTTSSHRILVNSMYRRRPC